VIVVSQPLPILSGRLDHVERRQESTEVAVASLTTTVAVHTEQIAAQREDLHEVAIAFKEAGAATNKRIDRLLQAVWAAVALLIPTAVSLIALVIQNR
jgi:hypothetical protein